MSRGASTIFFVLCILTAKVGIGQERCGIVADTEKMKDAGLIPRDDQVFEDWLREKMLRPRISGAMRTAAPPYKVPVVVHVIHNGESPGNGTNISDAQVLSQIRVLNEDFNRLNDDASDTPPEFAALAGSMDIEFVLARQDPEGLATNGIVRVQGSQTSWTSDDNYELKSQSYWPSENYFNIWVCNLTDLLGSAQFPESSLPGLGTSSNNALTDGIVIWYRAFGSRDDDDGSFNLASDYDKGRTTTHETGHFLGLRHIWGDDGSSCSGSDYVNDTPNQARSSSSCPEHPRSDGCSDAAMFQNYMDYTDDRCMNLFTNGQISRMVTVIENSPRRASLLTSPGLLEPVPVPNDAGIRAIVSPAASHCSTTLTPAIEVRNYGSNEVSSARIRFSINGSVVETKDAVLDGLGFLETSVVTFNPVLVTPGDTRLSFQILLTNGVTDGNANNNLREGSVFVPESASLPFSENFDILPGDWTIENPDQRYQWEIAAAPNESPGNNALMMNFFDYADAYGEQDIFLSPLIDLSTVPVASLIFDVSYAQYLGSQDRLKVVVITDCQDIAEGTVVFDLEGSVLATADPPSGPFTPSGASEWRRELVNLDQFLGEANVQIAFVAVNDWGNNLYIDNVSMIISSIEDVALMEVVSPSLVTCDLSPEPRIVVQNSGNITISSFDIRYKVNDGPVQVLHADGLNLLSGFQITIDLPAIDLATGLNRIMIDLDKPNGVADSIPSNDSTQFITVVNTARDRIPLFEDFDSSFEDEWTRINPEGGMSWQTATTNFNTSLYFNAFENTQIGDEGWLVSPVLDFSRTTGASVVFDLSHRSRQGRNDDFRILVSEDCGNTYRELDFSLTSPQRSSAWVPETEEDWDRNIEVNLDELAGSTEARVAFVATNANGNNLFIDNIEFFTTSDPDPIEIGEIYAIYGYNLASPDLSALKITFNLQERSDVRYSVVDMMGKFHADGLLTDVLNQTFPLNLEQTLAPGIYIVRLKIGERFYSERVLISR